MSNLNESYVYEMPSGIIQIEDILFNLPNQYTGGAFINLWLITLWSIFFIGGLVFNQGPKRSSLYAGFGGFIVTFLMTLGGWAGGNQLIPATVFFIATLAVNYVSDGGVQF